MEFCNFKPNTLEGMIISGNRKVIRFNPNSFILTSDGGVKTDPYDTSRQCRIDEIARNRNILCGSFVCHKCGASFEVKPI